MPRFTRSSAKPRSRIEFGRPGRRWSRPAHARLRGRAMRPLRCQGAAGASTFFGSLRLQRGLRASALFGSVVVAFEVSVMVVSSVSTRLTSAGWWRGSRRRAGVFGLVRHRFRILSCCKGVQRRGGARRSHGVRVMERKPAAGSAPTAHGGNLERRPIDGPPEFSDCLRACETSIAMHLIADGDRADVPGQDVAPDGHNVVPFGEAHQWRHLVPVSSRTRVWHH
jgi:hypothetical protein